MRIENRSTGKKSRHLLRVKAVQVELSRDELVVVRDEIQDYLDTPAGLAENGVFKKRGEE